MARSKGKHHRAMLMPESSTVFGCPVRLTGAAFGVVIMAACGDGDTSSGVGGLPKDVTHCISVVDEVPEREMGIEFHETTLTNTCDFTVNLGFVTYILNLNVISLAGGQGHTESSVFETSVFIACRPPSLPEDTDEDALGIQAGCR